MPLAGWLIGIKAIAKRSLANEPGLYREALIDTRIHLDRIDPDLIDRFVAELERLWPSEDRTGPLGLAVSGGADSLALLLLGAAAMPDDIAVMSVDHGLRADAAQEVALVQSVCSALDVDFTPATVKLAPGNIQASARKARYDALARWAGVEGLGAVATAHHADDQAETVLMRLARGSGVSGLAGVRAFGTLPGSDVALVRPLLGFLKRELEQVVRDCGLDPVRDPSNTNTAFDRVRVRQHLAQHEWLDPHALAKSAEHLAESWRAIEWYAEMDFEEMVERIDPADHGPDDVAPDGADPDDADPDDADPDDADPDDAGDGTPDMGPTFRYICNVPRAIQVETVIRIVAELGGRVTRAEAGRAADRLWRGENASLGGVLAVAGTAPLEGTPLTVRVWHFRIEPPRRAH